MVFSNDKNGKQEEIHIYSGKSNHLIWSVYRYLFYTLSRLRGMGLYFCFCYNWDINTLSFFRLVFTDSCAEKFICKHNGSRN